MVIGMRVFLDACVRNLQQRPAARRLGALTVAGALAAGVLAVVGSGLLAQLVGGLAVVPLSVMAYLMLLPVWSTGSGGASWPGDDGPDGPTPQDGPDGGTDWASFESQFWSYVERERQATPV
jgi:hypothetical protein